VARTRKRLTLNELIEDYRIIEMRNTDFSSLGRSEKRAIWKKWCDEHYPELEPCPFCFGTCEEGLVFEKGTPFFNYHNSGSLDAVKCNACLASLQGSTGTKPCVEHWNSAPRPSSTNQ
jgi:hypothetical protein